MNLSQRMNTLPACVAAPWSQMWGQVIEKMMRTGSHLSSHHNIAVSFTQEIQVAYFCLAVRHRADAFLFPSIKR